MDAKKSQRRATLGVFGLIAAGYLVNFVIFSLPVEWQYTAGGLVLIALGVLWIYFLGASETLVCDRPLNTCRLTRPRFILTPKSVTTFPLDSIREVRVDETYVSSLDGPGRTGYEVRIRTVDERIHVVSTEDNPRTAAALAKRIRTFVADDTPNSLKERRVTWMMVAVGGASIIMGVLLALGVAAG